MQDTLRYNVYIRKSSEEEDRQAPSLESQWENLEPIIKAESLNVVNVYQEACSAKRHGKRDEFYQMTNDIEKGNADAILVWSPNRISRNAVDTGLVIDLLDREKLLEIKTPGQIFKSNPSDKFFFSLLCSQAKLENDNKGLDIKRGLKHKAEMGWHPGRMRVGYISGEEEKGYKTIQKDPKRFAIVKKMLRRVCEDKQSPASILKLATEKWGLTRPKNGKSLGYSTWYDMLHDPFYYGKFEYPAGSGKWYQGKHTPMITKKQFDKIQQILGRVDKAKPKTHEFLFTGLMKCGECGRSITAERKTKLLKSGEKRLYTYYHCSRRFKEQCSQGSVREHQIQQALCEKLQTIQLSTPVFKHLINTVRVQLTKGHEQRNKHQKTHESELQSCETKLTALIDMRACGELTQSEFLERKNSLTKEKEALMDKIDQSQINPEKVLANLKSLQEFIELALDRLQDSDDIQGIKRILKIICSNQEIIDKKPVITLKTPFQLFACPVKVTYPGNGVARTEKTRITKGKTGLRENQFPVMLREPDDVRTNVTFAELMSDIVTVAEEIGLLQSLV